MCAVIVAPVLLSLLSIPLAAQVPAPESVLGFRVGADSQLASWRQIGEYFGRLAAASRMVRVDTLGPTTQGRPYLLVTISDSANLAHRAELMANQRRLADPRTLDSAAESRLVASQPAVVLISCSVHSTEIAASQMSMELAWRLVTDPALAALLHDVVVLLVPSANPDGIDIVGDWYRQTRGTRWDGTSPPWLWHPYVGHDDNRDWFMLTQVETRVLTRVLYRDWFPEVVYDVHQMGSNGSRMFVPPFSDPVDPNIDPLIVGGTNLVGAAMAAALLDAGREGIAHRERFDLWWDGGLRTVPARHNMIGILSEAASARIASPLCLAAAAVRQGARGVDYPAPWTPGCWHLRDIVDDELIAAQALARLAAHDRAAFVQRFVSAGRRAILAGRSEQPAAFLLPPGEDVARRAHMANLLLATGVEVHRAQAPFAADGRSWPAGTLVVRMDQPFRAHAKDLLEVQRYPDRRLYPGGPAIPPYDVTGWTLPLQMDVQAVAVASLPDVPLQRLDTVTLEPGAVDGRGDVVLLDNTVNGHIAAVWGALAAGADVQFAPRAFDAAGKTWPAGTLLVRGGRAALEAAARRYGFHAPALRRAPALPPGRNVRGVPRVAVYRSWNANMDEGWTRWVLEQLGVPFTSVTDSTIRAAALRAQYDVVILPSESDSAIAFGRRPGSLPDRYTGGLGESGVAALRAFLAAGGTVIAIDQASRFAVARLGASAGVVATGGRGGEGEPGTEPAGAAGTGPRFSAPGSIFAVAVDRSHPIASGYGAEAMIYFLSSAVLDAGGAAHAVLSYPREGSPLRSGYLEGAELLAGRAALVDAPVGNGRVILFGFRPQHRGQTHGTFRLLTNAILYGSSQGPGSVAAGK
jgi:hypothetical protein